jgi:hypothetical protein
MGKRTTKHIVISMLHRQGMRSDSSIRQVAKVAWMGVKKQSPTPWGILLFVLRYDIERQDRL